VHRLDDLAVGSAHREEAYELSRLALERLKAEVPIWKLERYPDGTSLWREEEPLGAAGA
jgi:molybdopterin synthase catalytic subunit